MLTDILGIVGLGMSIFGGLGQSGVAKQQANVSAGIAGDEEQLNTIKQRQNTLSTNRAQLENLRNVQRARAQGVNSAVQGGAQFGSGMAGGQAQVADAGMTNSVGLSQKLQTSNEEFGVTGDIDQKKIQMAQLGGQMATDAGWASLGGSLTKSAPMLGNIFKMS